MGQLSVMGALKAGLPCFGVMFRGDSVLENLLGSSGMFQWWNTTKMDSVVSRSDTAGEGHVPFEGTLRLGSAAFTHWLLPRKSSQIAFCISRYACLPSVSGRDKEEQISQRYRGERHTWKLSIEKPSAGKLPSKLQIL